MVSGDVGSGLDGAAQVGMIDMDVYLMWFFLWLEGSVRTAKIM